MSVDDFVKGPVTKEMLERYLNQRPETASTPVQPKRQVITNKKIMNLINKRRQVEAEMKSAIMESDVYYSQLQTYRGNVNAAYTAALKYFTDIF